MCVCACVCAAFSLRPHRYRTSTSKKWDKGERFKMQFEDGKDYLGSIVGCVDCVVVEEHRTAATGGSVAAQPQPDLGVPWEALQVLCRGRLSRAVLCFLVVALVSGCCVCA